MVYFLRYKNRLRNIIDFSFALEDSFELGRVCFGVPRAVAKVWLRKELRSACHHRILPCILGPRPSFHNCMNEWLWMDWKLRSIPRLRISFLFMPLPLASRPLTDILENIFSFDITLRVRLNYFGCLSLTVNVLTSTRSVIFWTLSDAIGCQF